MIKWLYPGMHVKRWLFLILIGITMVALGLAYFYVEIYRTQPFPAVAYELTLQFLPRWARGLLFLSAGGLIVLAGVIQLNRSLLSAFVRSSGDSVVDMVYQHRYLQKGPRIVAIGGGHGLYSALRGLKEYTGNLTAIVTVADNGGSSGRLRRELGVLPPGDFRQCIVALADDEQLVTQLFQYRFDAGSSLEGHSFGNLFIVAMSTITGNFERALQESCRVLAVRGQILPSTLADVTLCAEFEGEREVEGETEIASVYRPIKRVFLRPDHPAAHPEAIQAILKADLIVIGPGSLYTSVLPNLLVEDIARAIKVSNALKVYVCNVATQPGETDGYGVLDHIEAFKGHLGDGLFHFVLVNDNFEYSIRPEAKCEAVKIDNGLLENRTFRTVLADLVDPENPVRHSPKKLAQNIMNIYYDKAQAAIPRQKTA